MRLLCGCFIQLKTNFLIVKMLSPPEQNVMTKYEQNQEQNFIFITCHFLGSVVRKRGSPWPGRVLLITRCVEVSVSQLFPEEQSLWRVPQVSQQYKFKSAVIQTVLERGPKDSFYGSWLKATINIHRLGCTCKTNHQFFQIITLKSILLFK